MAEFPGLKRSRELPSPKDPRKYADPENKAFPLWPRRRITVAHSYIHKYWQWKKAGRKMSGVTATYTNAKFARVHTRIVRAMIDNGITHNWLDDGLDNTLPESLKKKSKGYPRAGAAWEVLEETGLVIAEKETPPIQIAKEVDIRALTEGDESPMFVYVRALKEGRSRNGRVYKKEILRTILENLPLYGYRGHPEFGNRFRDPLTIWIGGAIEGDWLFLKGYVPAVEQGFRAWLKAGMAAGAPMPVSIYGRARMKPLDNGDMEVLEFIPISVDWVPHREEGVPGAQVVQITAERRQGGDGMEKVTREEVLSALTLEDLEEERPDLVEEILAKHQNTGGEDSRNDEIAELREENAKLKEQLLKSERERLLAEIPDEKLRSLADKLLTGETVEELKENWKKVKEELSGLAPELGVVSPAGSTEEKEGADWINEAYLN